MSDIQSEAPMDDMPRGRKRVVEAEPKANGYGSEPKRTKLPASDILGVLGEDIAAQIAELGPAFLEGIENSECKQAATLSLSVKYNPPKDDDSPVGEFVVQAKLATKSIDRARRVDISSGQLDLF